jgi:hypothetical protein
MGFGGDGGLGGGLVSVVVSEGELGLLLVLVDAEVANLRLDLLSGWGDEGEIRGRLGVLGVLRGRLLVVGDSLGGGS